MNPHPLHALFAAARRRPPAVPPPGFPERVRQALPQRPTPAVCSASWTDDLARFLPRLALSTALVVSAAGAVDLWFGGPHLTDYLAEATLAAPLRVEESLTP